MGAPIGFFSDDNQNDYPELNKCPDCETYFQTLYCPLCGKECPEEMRAGNRKVVKPKKKKRRGNNSGRVQFVPWYYSGWFIFAMLIIFPIAGVILLWMSDWSRGWKIGGTLFAVGRYVLVGLISFLVVFFSILLEPKDPFEYPDIPREEYISACESVDPEDLFRYPEAYEKKQVTLELTVRGIWNDESAVDVYDIYNGDYNYPVYYECTATVNGREVRFLVRDQVRNGRVNLVVGDTIRLWGAVEGNRQITNQTAGTLSGPCIRMYFVELQQTRQRAAVAELPIAILRESGCSCS